MIFTYKKIPAFLTSLLLAVLMTALPFADARAQSKTEIVKEIDDYIKKNMEVNHITGVSLAITHSEDVFYTQGYGAYSDGREITSRTPFPIASLSKSMTALAVLQLADKGQIDLDAPYVSYFPDISPTDDRITRITIRNLLNHTSGLNDKVNPDMTKSVQFKTLQEINKSLDRVKLANDPGDTYNYHNPNYQYLALLVEQISGKRFSVYLKEHIFAPLGMNGTFSVSMTEQINENDAIPRGHYLLFGNPKSTAEPLWFIEGPAGVVTNAEDMAKWMRAQYNPQLLSPNLMEQYHTGGQRAPYGMGWLASNEADWGRSISHSGIFWTYKAEETVYLDKELGITMMFDTGINAFLDYSAFVKGVSQIMVGGKAEMSAINSRNMEIAMILLMAGTILWSGYSFYRLKKKKNRLTAFRRKLIFASVRTILPVLILLFLPSILAIFAGGRVVPWNGIWMMMPSLIIWLVLLVVVNLVNNTFLYFIYFNSIKKRKSSAISK
ncbi:serine hydrolase domain-containing protein [Cytobacillus oceanisediminis]|uniref:serine hydrolase domain-containing protein n=1 Tax=Cytobacillus oceanisediminis TaxID=665099 RepID=UPI0020794DD0|nr:serine hydrolase domain-containing protein [Cytobacillus oceanisediminis]USK42123.1 beta-lactamase family protein [Cytobacillus oceanisediminis]